MGGGVTEFINIFSSVGVVRRPVDEESCEELERQIDQACAEVTRAIDRRRDELVRAARNTRSQAIANMRSLTSHAAQKLREATSLLHFSIEALKESDHAAFLQVGNILSARAQETAAGLCSSLDPPPSPPALTLDIEPVLRTVRTMNFVECIRDRAGSVKRRTPDEATPNELKEKNKLIEAEKTETGSVKWSVYKHYLTSVGVLASVITVLMNLVLQLFQVGSNYWLSEWSNDRTIICNITPDSDLILLKHKPP